MEVNVPISGAGLVKSISSQAASNAPSIFKEIIGATVSVIKPLVNLIGIHLPYQGYVIVASIVLAVTLYYLHKMTIEILKAFLVGIIIAVVLHLVGLI